MATVSNAAYAEILQLKTEGNNYFAKRQYEVAIKYYTSGLDHVVYSSNEWARNHPLVELRQSLLLNRAKSHYKLENLKDALIDSAHCIQCQQNSKLSYKAHFTRAEIYHYVNHHKNAIRHCDAIIAAPSEMGLSALQSRTRKLRKQIAEKSLQMERTTIGGHHSEVERMQHAEHQNASSEVAILVSSKWWRTWYAIPADTKLSDVDVSIAVLNVDNSELIHANANGNNDRDEVKETASALSAMSLATATNGAADHKQEAENEEDVVEIASVYLDHNLVPNLKVGRANDFVLLNFAAYNCMIKLGYKISPVLYVKHSEVYKTKFTVYFGDHKVSLLSSAHETIGKIAREIARHFVITSSSIRLRYKSKYGVILDASHTLLQHEMSNKYAIYVEVRLPNGCWPIHDNIAQYDHQPQKHKSSNKSQLVVCGACHRLISHFVDCPKKEQCNVYAKYCNGAHVRAHFPFHFEYEHKRNFRKAARLGLTALQNLGNTCYMNSSVQCLSFIAELRSYLIADDYVSDINKDNPLGYKGELARVFSIFLKKLWFGTASVISPRDFRYATAKLYHQWDTTQQQDAEEFLRWLLDGLHEDLNLIRKKPYYALDDSNGRSDHVVADEHWQLHLRRNQSVIVDLFQGQYKSALTCPHCDAKSVKFDAFSALTLPIPDRDTMIPVHCLVFTSRVQQAPYKLTVNVSAKAVVTQLTDVLREKLGTHLTAHHDDEADDEADAKNNNNNNDNDADADAEEDGDKAAGTKEYKLLICKVNHNKFGKYWSSGRPIKKVLGRSTHSSSSSSRVQAYTYIYEVLSTTITQRKTDNLVQCRMNFRYQPRRNLSDSSGGSDDDAQTEHSAAAAKCTYFAHPIVFDIAKPLFSGNNVYEHFKRRFETFARAQVQPPMPSVQMFVERSKDDGSSDEVEMPFNDEPLLLSNELRNLATINVEFSSEYEYSKYVDQAQAITDVDFNKLSDEKPKNHTDIYDCLKLYTAAEVLDEANWQCSSCKRQCEPSKQISLWRLPEILIVHLKRFVNVQGVFGGVGRKNSLEIKTPINGLDLKPFLADTTNIGEIPKYDLFATVNHNGIMDFGHYYCCVRTDDSTRLTNFYDHYNEVARPEWHVFNDEQSRLIAAEDVNHYIKDAYLLFYRRRNSV